MEVVTREVGIGVSTLERWREDARLEAVISTAALDEAGKSAWCRQHGVYPGELDKWRGSATAALAEPEEARGQPAGHAGRQEVHQGA